MTYKLKSKDVTSTTFSDTDGADVALDELLESTEPQLRDIARHLCEDHDDMRRNDLAIWKHLQSRCWKLIIDRTELVERLSNWQPKKTARANAVQSTIEGLNRLDELLERLDAFKWGMPWSLSSLLLIGSLEKLQDYLFKLGLIEAQAVAKDPNLGAGVHWSDKYSTVRLQAPENLPQLEGSDKQIAWAEQIRQNLLSIFSAITPYLETLPADNQGRLDLEKDRKALFSIRRAAFWIDRRDAATLHNLGSSARAEVRQNR